MRVLALEWVYTPSQQQYLLWPQAGSKTQCIWDFFRSSICEPRSWKMTEHSLIPICSLFINPQCEIWLSSSYYLVSPPVRKPMISRIPQTSSFWSPKSIILDPSLFLAHPQPHVQTFLSFNRTLDSFHFTFLTPPCSNLVLCFLNNWFLH